MADTPPVKPASRVKRLAAAALEASLITALTFGLIASTAFAAKGGGHRSGGGSSISAPVMVTDTGTLGLSFGDTITFTVSTTATDAPFVNVQCFQDGVLVYNTSAGFFSWAMNAPYYDFTLSSGGWRSGAADCTAYLQVDANRGWSTLASTKFHADG